MMKPEDTTPEEVTDEMKTEAAAEARDNATAVNVDEKPPDPPKRDYNSEKTDEASYARVQKRKAIGSFPKPHFVYKPENPEAWMSCLRLFLIVFNLFIWVLGAAITALGIWMKVDEEFWRIQSNLEVTQFTSASWILIFVGVIIMVIGFIGCYGAAASSICFLIIFAIVVIIVIIMEMVVMALVWTTVSNKNVLEQVKLKAKTAMGEMVQDDKKRDFIELIQAKLHCCGVDGPNDYSIDPNKVTPVPPSCTNPETASPYEKGCYDAVVEYLRSKAAVVGGVAVAVFLLQLGALVFTICMVCGLKQAAGAII